MSEALVIAVFGGQLQKVVHSVGYLCLEKKRDCPSNVRPLNTCGTACSSSYNIMFLEHPTLPSPIKLTAITQSL